MGHQVGDWKGYVSLLLKVEGIISHHAHIFSRNLTNRRCSFETIACNIWSNEKDIELQHGGNSYLRD